MTTPVDAGSWTLSEKEKQTLRLIVRGHDAKSIARTLGLSVHTINERLRDARRKMAVSSSREAARMLLAFEGAGAGPEIPDSLGNTQIGEDARRSGTDQDSAPDPGVGPVERRSPRILIGATIMTFVLGILALAIAPQIVSVPATTPAAAQAATNPEVIDAARS